MLAKSGALKRSHWLMGFAMTVGVTALAANPARADVNIDGIDIPTGAVLVANVIEENLVSSVGDTLTGIGTISSIQQNLHTTYTYGLNQDYLTFVFTGFKVSYILFPSPTSAGYIEFTGGTANVYLETGATQPDLTTGSQATDIANASSGGLFLGTTAELFGTNPTVQLALGPTTTTLEAQLPNNTTLGNFTNAFGSAFLDATSGPAEFNFHTCALVPNPGVTGGTCPSGEADLSFTESFNSGASGDFPVSGTSSIKANVIPEPGTVGLLGVALLLLGGLTTWRRRGA